MSEHLFLAFDTETTGKFDFKAPTSAPHQPRIVSMAACLFNAAGEEISTFYTLIRPEGFTIPDEVVEVHGITTEKALQYGIPFEQAYAVLESLVNVSEHVLIFNEQFDRNMTDSEMLRRYNTRSVLHEQKAKLRCVMLLMAARMKQPSGYGDYKWPNLAEAYKWLYQKDFVGAHGALADARATGWMGWTISQMGDWNFEIS
jgi:DNA polymerase III epsilon subunit-like protein